jgi:hypothetical protein
MAAPKSHKKGTNYHKKGKVSDLPRQLSQKRETITKSNMRDAVPKV